MQIFLFKVIRWFFKGKNEKDCKEGNHEWIFIGTLGKHCLNCNLTWRTYAQRIDRDNKKSRP